MRKALQRQLAELQGVIHRRNLYSHGSRYFNPAMRGEVLTVENLYTGERKAWVNDGSFTDGYGQAVLLSSRLAEKAGAK